MTLSRAKYVELIQKLEGIANTDPKLYEMRTIALALAGYAYVIFILILLIALCIGMVILIKKFHYVAFKLGIPLVIIIGLILRSLWIKFPPTEGIKLEKADAPVLFQTIEEIARSVSGPSIHSVYLTSEFNAAIRQVPRLGLFGWFRNDLIVGMPLMQSLSMEQFRAVLAHEMGHLSGHHGKVSSWIYGSRSSWLQLLESLEKDRSFAVLLFTKFFSWFVPYFDACSFVLARKHEYEADRLALNATSKDAAATALIATDLRARNLEKNFWPRLSERTKQSPEAPKDLFSSLGKSTSSNLDPLEAESWLEKSFQEKTDYTDTHPCLKDRIAAILSLEPQACLEYARKHLDTLVSPTSSAADILFGTNLTELLIRLDTDWNESMSNTWQERHKYFQTLSDQLKDLEEKSARTAEELKKMAYLVVELKGFKDAKPWFEKALETFPDDAELHTTYGEWLLHENDPQCLKHLEHAIKLEPIRGYECSQMMYAFHKGNNNETGAENLLPVLDEHYDKLAQCRQERAELRPKEVLQFSNLAEEKTTAIADALQSYKDIKAAYLFKKQVAIFPEYPCYVLALEIKRGLFDGDNKEQELVDKIAQEIEFPGETYIVTFNRLSSDQKKLARQCQIL